MTPYPPYLRRVLRDSALLWLLLRAAYGAALLFGAAGSTTFPPGEAMAAALQPTLPSRFFLVALTAFLVWLDRRRARELLLAANFGVSASWFLAASALAAAALDVTVQTVVRVL